MIHLLSGDSMTPHLDRAGIEGDRIVWREALVDGPAPGGVTLDEFRRARADFVAESYGEDRARVLADLEALDRAVESIPPDEEVVFWFDRDLFCRVNLGCAAHRLGDHRGTLRLVERERFLCELRPEELREAFDSRVELGREAAELWEAYAAPTPERLNALSASHSFAALHLSRFPSAASGVGSVGEAILRISSLGEIRFTDLFKAFSRDDAAFGFGDLQVLNEITRLATLLDPLLVLDIGLGDSLSATIDITDRGRRVMNGSEKLNPGEIDVWLGGVHVTARALWEWDEEAKLARLA
ncbi:MAG TPA: hypothetical protein VIL97_07255 [Thermoanaerobaculia bacterium]